MTVGQVTYPTKPGTAFAGMLADLTDNDVISRINKEATALPFGIAVAMVDSQENQAVLPVDANSLILGLAAHSHAYDNASLTGALGVPVGDMINVVRRGRLWCVTEAAVDEGDDVYVRYTAAGGFAKGALSNASDAGKNGKLVGAVWKTVQATPGGLAIVEINLIGVPGALT